MQLEEFTEFADKVVEEDVPPELLRDLHMGIIVLEEEMSDEEGYHVMGEYVSNELGNHILLYYGSFACLLEKEGREAWEKEIRETVKHEIVHHVEALAGNEQLAREEMLEREGIKSRQQGEPQNHSVKTGFIKKLLDYIKRVINI